MERRVYLATIGGALTAGGAGCLTAADLGIGASEDHDVGMSRNEFTPERYEASIGETVVWKNTSEARHTVTAYEGAIPDGADYFASGGFEDETAARRAWEDDFGGLLEPRDTYEHAFEVPGTYSYFCIPHEVDGNGDARMVAIVEVSE